MVLVFRTGGSIIWCMNTDTVIEKPKPRRFAPVGEITDAVIESRGEARSQRAKTLREAVQTMRRTKSAKATAEALGIPLGTVKSICSLSGVFRDNQRQRDFFKLPEIKPSESTAIAVRPPLPPKPKPSGDPDIDAVFWLRTVIETGDDEHIAMALEAAKQIKTPLKEIEKRYASMALDIAVLLHGRDAAFAVALSTMGWGDLTGKAKGVLEKKATQREAVARFGSKEKIFNDQATEQFCIDSLALVPISKKPSDWKKYPDTAMVCAAFASQPEYAPHTLADCIYEYDYWDALYSLRNGFDGYCDHLSEVQAREDYLFHCLAQIKPRNRDEAKAVLHWMQKHDRMECTGGDAILDNLIG
jgi:hypothetical protein